MVMAAVAFVVIVLAAMLILSVTLRRYLSRSREEDRNPFEPKAPPSENAQAFMTASMQAVITRLREQEKELARLHQAEKERAQQTERLSEAVTRNMPTGLLLINSSHLITYANPAAATVLGIQTLQYRRFKEVLGESSPLSGLIADCLAGGATFQREQVEHNPPGGGVRQLGVTISPVVDTRLGSPRKITGAVCLLTDLTELMALQRQIRLKEGLATLGELSAGIAHEFKNSLATISGYAQLLNSGELPPDQAECAQKIVAETRAMSHLVTEFLRFARPLEVCFNPVDVRTLVEKTVAEFRESRPGVTVEGEFAEVEGDDTLLRQALQNLLRNATEASQTSPGSPLVVVSGEVTEEAGRPIQRIAVLDSGPGLPETDRDKLFIPFYTTKTGGTGLGLAVVQKIAVHHGGSVEARNRPEGGAAFVLSLPIRQTAQPEAVETTPERI
jgi:signal transduction histidine kinase